MPWCRDQRYGRCFSVSGVWFPAREECRLKTLQKERKMKNIQEIQDEIAAEFEIYDDGLKYNYYRDKQGYDGYPSKDKE